MLLARWHRLLHLRQRLRRRNRGILRVIRTSIRREDVVTRAAGAVVERQVLRVVVVVAPAGFDGAAEDVRERGALAFHFFAAAAGEEGDEEEDEADYGDAAYDAAGDGAFVGLFC